MSGFVGELEKATKELSDLAAQLDANPTEHARIEPRLLSLLEHIRRLTNQTGSSTPQRLGLWQPLSSPTFEEPAAVEAVQCDDDAGVISYDDRSRTECFPPSHQRATTWQLDTVHAEAGLEEGPGAEQTPACPDEKVPISMWVTTSRAK